MAKNNEKKKGGQGNLGLKIEETELGKKAKELLEIQSNFSEIQDSMTTKKEEVLKLMKVEKRQEIKIEGKRIFIKTGEDTVSVKTIKDAL